MPHDIDSKVIGYFAYSSPMGVICDGDACLISGPEEAMSNYIKFALTDSSKAVTIKKTRFGEIIQGMKKGGGHMRLMSNRITVFIHLLIKQDLI